MADSQKGIDPIAYLVYGENPQLRASATARLHAIREDRLSAFVSAESAYRNKEQALLKAVSEWKQSEPAERPSYAIQVGILQKDLAKLDQERRGIQYPQRFLQQIPPVFLGRGIQIPVAERTIPL